MITVYSYYNGKEGKTEYIGDDTINSGYETEYGRQGGPGVWVVIRNRYANTLDDLAPTHRILSAQFVFASYYNGNIKTKTVSPEYYDSASTSLISGYYPTKVIVTYRKMTPYETSQWYNQFNI